VDYLPRNFPDGRIDLNDMPAAADLSHLTTDPADIHVCALAVAAKANYLFTHDHGYLRDGLERHQVRVTRPDDFLSSAFDADPRGMLAVMERQALSWAGGRPIEDLLDTIERAGAPLLASKARTDL
jgi:hypothetical protein